jgi:hypothetical protein
VQILAQELKIDFVEHFTVIFSYSVLDYVPTFSHHRHYILSTVLV